MNRQNLSQYLSHHETVLKHLVSTSSIPAERIKEAILYALFPGGKRLRPSLVYLAGEILGLEPNCMDFLAAAVELTHCYSLIHDDLPAMDNDDWRRGRPSCHKAFDEATAILAGDGMQALAVEILLTNLPKILAPTQTIEVARVLVEASGIAGMVSGQSLDLSELAKPNLSEAELRNIHLLKTGKLITACIKMAIAATTPPAGAGKALIHYANYLGLVFQMQDDYLDCYAKTNVLGKGRASDLANKKMTFANLLNQEDLSLVINQHFCYAKEALDPLGNAANALLALTDSIQLRSNFIEE